MNRLRCALLRVGHTRRRGRLAAQREDPAAPRRRSSGQALVLFVITSVLVMGMVALVIDIAWFWTNEQSMQKAADAGALAGAVYLPGNVWQAYSSAAAEARKNGYVNGVSGVVVTPRAGFEQQAAPERHHHQPRPDLLRARPSAP